MEEVRARFAPSPTGSLHIGGARTALFNYLFARRYGGRFILRIEDTDQTRSRAELIQGFLSGFRWLGLEWDEGPGVGGAYGPYLQSERGPLYREAVDRLLASGRAYRCYCRPEELAERREEARRAGRAPRYDGRCARLTPAQEEALGQEGRPAVVRFRAPVGETVVEDLIRGRVVFDNQAVMDDFVIAKSDGFPTYNLAAVVDDNAMRISHVIRAEEHLSNTPKQMALYEALGLPAPRFAHVPMILAPDRSKLSKRHGATGLDEFMDDGFLPEAVVNYLLLLGWSPPDGRELITLDEAVANFSLERVQKSAAVYDKTKMTWLNGTYLRNMEPAELIRRATPFLQRAALIGENLSPAEEEYLGQIILLVRDRVSTLVEVAEAAVYFYREPEHYDEKGVRKHLTGPQAEEILSRLCGDLEALPSWDLGTLEESFTQLATEMGIPRGQLIHPTRLAVTGRTMGPGLFEIVQLLGREKVLGRLGRLRAERERVVAELAQPG